MAANGHEISLFSRINSGRRSDPADRLRHRPRPGGLLN